MQLKILITGTAGFIGGYLARYLAMHTCKVYGTYRNHFPESLKTNDTINLYWTDLDNLNQLPNQYDVLIHCGAETSSDRIDEIKYNAVYSKNIFEHAAQANARLIIFLSTMSIYGEINTDIVDEHTAIKATDPYGISKYQSEEYLKRTLDKYNHLAGLTIRLPGVVGANSKQNFLSKCLISILKNDKIIASNPEALFNNVVYVGDLAKFISLYIKKYQNNYEVTNIASQNPLKIKQVLELLQKFSNKNVEVNFNPTSKKSFLISLDKINSLGYQPESVYNALNYFVRDYINNL